jgi:hypothetical protein
MRDALGQVSSQYRILYVLISMLKNGNTKGLNLQKSLSKMVVKKVEIESYRNLSRFQFLRIENKCFYLKGQPIKRMQERMILKRKNISNYLIN